MPKSKRKHGKPTSELAQAIRALSLHEENSSTSSLLDAVFSDTEFIASEDRPVEGPFDLFTMLTAEKPLYTMDDLEKDPDEISTGSLSYRAFEELKNEFEELPDFFDLLQEPATPSDMSLADRTTSLRWSSTRQKSRASIEGQFYDPLTGDKLSSMEEEETEKTEEREDKTDIIDSDEEEKVDLSIIMPELIVEKVIKRDSSDVEDDARIFFEVPEHKPTIHYDFELLAQEEFMRILNKDIHNIIIKIITHVVNKCEHFEVKEVLYRAFDKSKLLDQLKETQDHLLKEKQVNQFLIRKCGHYFRRKGAKRFIMENRKLHRNEQQKLLNLYDNLNCVIIEERTMTELLGNKIAEEQSHADALWEEISNAQNEFEDFVRTTLGTNRSASLKEMIEHHLNYFNAVRKDMRAVRLRLILQQHSRTKIFEEYEDMYHITDDLRLEHFDRINAEVQSLDKHIEGSKAELRKLHIEFKHALHSIAHCREKQLVMQESFKEEQVEYDNLVEEQDDLKSQVKNLELVQMSLRNELDELSYETGIIDKPALLYDYDSLTEFNETQTAVNARLREKIAYLSNECDRLEKNRKRDSLIF
ncbi:protein MLP1-like [Teleopsis dalmanni]|uniref:protein MLP1-like n=1 Tax=Teleopsis dalmanni TaxID=139649 RepID=UPI0018CCBDF8|nr:protein MLP1-like [Teleopsis dalmanni]